MYRIVIEQRAAKEIESLPSEIINRLASAIQSLQYNPHPRGVKKLIGEVGWRIRVSNYRILYTIDDKQKLITIYRVKHRKDAYR